MLPFWASRCFRSEFLRVILALAARTASVLVGCCFGCCVFAAFPTVGMIGSPWVGMIEPRSTGCIVIGPVDAGFLFGIGEHGERIGQEANNLHRETFRY